MIGLRSQANQPDQSILNQVEPSHRRRRKNREKRSQCLIVRMSETMSWRGKPVDNPNLAGPEQPGNQPRSRGRGGSREKEENPNSLGLSRCLPLILPLLCISHCRNGSAATPFTPFRNRNGCNCNPPSARCVR
ncbi:hypothetical protein HER10_EVM0012601 [Colletotrichum scovillei]|uniref:uncharacterized protein n=1 Tax=Colletotrichum scovillei TaxID=1209932 RepID=UPI0015C399D6|nr:uncharacterized protein HER10_EVM0012601 [Colletotrichum scovillei]KAF4777227.1 hypothetical protein HER10_EVM0012601 [Colletotrichum scovillei]